MCGARKSESDGEAGTSMVREKSESEGGDVWGVGCGKKREEWIVLHLHTRTTACQPRGVIMPRAFFLAVFGGAQCVWWGHCWSTKPPPTPFTIKHSTGKQKPADWLQKNKVTGIFPAEIKHNAQAMHTCLLLAAAASAAAPSAATLLASPSNTGAADASSWSRRAANWVRGDLEFLKRIV